MPLQRQIFKSVPHSLIFIHVKLNIATNLTKVYNYCVTYWLYIMFGVHIVLHNIFLLLKYILDVLNSKSAHNGVS